ncbi:MAG: hypothetical protein O7B35_07230 [Deltaproteobacteria bacterium]|nr:hypothetical protein [Deltaproteobacteria bacterium]
MEKIRIDLAIFFLLFLTYAYFFQGGAWGENGRFDQVRAIVEDGTLEIENFSLYTTVPDQEGKPDLRRIAIPPSALADIPLEKISTTLNTGDLSRFGGHIYPNKPPGATFTAVPAYFLVYNLNRLLGIHPDHWWPLTMNIYLTTVFSVSLIAALGGVVFYRTSLQLFPSSPPWAHIASTLTFGLGTLMLPYATMLIEHDLVAVLSLFAFLILLVNKKQRITSIRPGLILFLAGVVSGLTLLMQYTSIITVSCLVFYVFWTAWPRWKVAYFIAGTIPPVAVLGWYNLLCYGSPVAISYAHQGEWMLNKGGVLGMFVFPRFEIMAVLLFSGYRGLFFTSPVLLLSGLGIWLMASQKEKRVELVLWIVIFLGFLSANSSYNSWEGGWGIGPRFLIPALPFFCLPLTPVFQKFFRFTLVLASLSALIMLLATAVAPRFPQGIPNPMGQYILPLLLGEKIQLNLSHPSGEGFGEELHEGPVSANPIGVYESPFRRVYEPGSMQDRWNSFNLGEFLWPASLFSLLPLLCFLGLGLGVFWRWSRR